ATGPTHFTSAPSASNTVSKSATHIRDARPPRSRACTAQTEGGIILASSLRSSLSEPGHASTHRPLSQVRGLVDLQGRCSSRGRDRRPEVLAQVYGRSAGAGVRGGREWPGGITAAGASVGSGGN